jgi:antitoxin component HigA of HigAB toxin-antitoxin module
MNVSKLIEAIPSTSAADRIQMRANADRLMASGNDKQKNAALALVSAIDAQDVADQQSFDNRLTNMSQAEKVAEAFSAVKPTPSDLKAIRALLANPGSTTAELSAACGWKGNKWQSQLSLMCKKREGYLLPGDPDDERDLAFYSGLLSDQDEETNRFTMKPDIAAAFNALGLS